MTREEVKNYIGELKMYAKSQGWDEEYQVACDIAIKALEQETVSKDSYDHEYVLRKVFEIKTDKLRRQLKEQTLKAESILDRIRAEIETKYGQCDICEYFEDYDYEENDISEYRSIGNIGDILQILDKYKEKQEET